MKRLSLLNYSHSHNYLLESVLKVPEPRMLGQLLGEGEYSHITDQ